MNKYSILVGNGINCDQSEYSWGNLLKKLVTKYEVNIKNIGSKPFPLLYEAIYIESVKDKPCNELEIKSFIANYVKKISHNSIHQKLMGLDTCNILTTNYDLSLESCLIDTNINKLKNIGKVKESKYSIFRHYDVQGKNIWHIHGSANNNQSIILGYEHYSGYLQSMRNYVVSGTGNSYHKQFKPFIKKIEANKISYGNYLSWIDIFFLEDVHIIGLTLDFCEIDLWWLLTYRERQKHNHKFNIRNNIFYYISKKFDSKYQDKLDLLKIMGVKIVYIDNTNYDFNYYEKVINRISDKYS